METSGRRPSVHTGLYEHYIDAKARIILPGAFRQALGSSFTLSTGFDQCLTIWRTDEWLAFTEQEIARRSDLSQDARRLSRWFHANAHPITLDTQFRFVVPPPLRRYAGLEREIVLVGVRNRVEIWAKPAWEKYNEKTNNSIEEIAESLSRDLRV